MIAFSSLKTTATALALLCATGGFAFANAPAEERLAQLQTLLTSPEVIAQLGNSAIEAIEYDGPMEDGRLKFQIETEGCEQDLYLKGANGAYTVETPFPRCH